MSHSDQFEVVIPSDYESGQAVVERIMTEVGKAGFSSRDEFGIRLSVDEAVTNAIKHGNKLSPSGRGLMLMREFMTRIEFSPKGNRVVLEKLHQR